VQIYHRDGIETLYGHLSGFAVKAGDKVKKGQVIGYEGATGEATGPHVHFEVRVDGTAVNPLTYLQ
jgi:murein DD-endopeptidase MepM/ murein hydrolase activator NlpD